MDVLKSKELFFGCLKLYSDKCFDVVVTLSRERTVFWLSEAL